MEFTGTSNNVLSRFLNGTDNHRTRLGQTFETFNEFGSQKQPCIEQQHAQQGKKKEGNAARYITRSQAVKQLQVSLSLFRKLCILKGIFPREPKKKTKGNHHTYYHLKDVSFIQHEPLLERLREIRAYQHKIKKAEAKKNRDLATLLTQRRPSYKLDKIVLQRYPKFLDALRDLDDCLTMVHLFAALPAIEGRIEAEVKGQEVTWLAPHPLQQVLTDDIDFNIMLNFLEFYEALLAFVNCHLYHSINVRYPPILDPRLEAVAADLYALSRYFDANSQSSAWDRQTPSLSGSGKVESQQIGPSIDESELRLARLQHQLPSNEPGVLMHLVGDVPGEDKEDNDTRECKKLFKDMKFFLNREIIDRPRHDGKICGRQCVQPQWVYDCVNARIILQTGDYLVGRDLPPHLSPFDDNDYFEITERGRAAGINEVLPMPGMENEDLEDPLKLLAEGVINRAESRSCKGKAEEGT
ncbi:hypothetical protein ACE6H2_025936 [Prunus campanulata]